MAFAIAACGWAKALVEQTLVTRHLLYSIFSTNL